jgi:hypothetical protein
MKLKIESDGTIRGTRVINAATGEELEDVREVTWEWERGYPASVRISVGGGGIETDLSVLVDGRVLGVR